MPNFSPGTPVDSQISAVKLLDQPGFLFYVSHLVIVPQPHPRSIFDFPFLTLYSAKEFAHKKHSPWGFIPTVLIRILDLKEPSYVATCLKNLRSQPSTVLLMFAYPQIRMCNPRKPSLACLISYGQGSGGIHRCSAGTGRNIPFRSAEVNDYYLLTHTIYITTKFLKLIHR